jgi:hypothetical protein
MKDPREYLDEIRQNLRKLQDQGQVTPADNALFGMVDGLAGLQLVILERITALEKRAGVQPINRGTSGMLHGRGDRAERNGADDASDGAVAADRARHGGHVA